MVLALWAVPLVLLVKLLGLRELLEAIAQGYCSALFCLLTAVSTTSLGEWLGGLEEIEKLSGNTVVPHDLYYDVLLAPFVGVKVRIETYV